ncbi:DEAD/DEAH box helicase [Pseudomonas coleopterorum]|uniref:DEAD/DEAH box helicase n=1 Tax=Pseudomonas coleopterorum TaxID=1605838 RepID=UPI0008959F39|nr:DEAD/DEAH box helicase [Pseudomonas coleopterorum]SED97954.1 ATP-dependent helicase Lhr and Lhr-like helicase [Pseudomonas coleopterorum]
MNLPAQPDSPLAHFHPAVSAWFSQHFAAVTPAQAQAWPLIQQGLSTLIAAPTGSGKTLTAFLAVLDELVKRGLEHQGRLPQRTTVLYVSPLKALSNDIQLNLQRPLQGIAEQLTTMNLPAVTIVAGVRTGDTPQKERAAMRRQPPHILVTTPESLYVLLGSDSGRGMLADVHTVIVDEIHAVAGSKRGSHLALSLERLQALCSQPLRRIGLSATQKPIAQVAQFLVGAQRACSIVDIGHARPRDLAIEVPAVPLAAVMPNDVWELLYDRLAALAQAHRTTLVFVNTRRLAERVARHMSERLGREHVAAHHGSLAKEHRLDAEQRLKRGDLQVLVATASLELGIDIGDVDLVCQIASPGSISAFLQRVGRSGHHVGGVPKGRLFPISRDDLIECVALLDCVRRGELDTLQIPQAPLDVLAQQIIAEVSCQEWPEQALLQMFRQATPYAGLDDARFEGLLRMLAEGYSGRQGVRAAYVHRDAVTRTLRGRRGSKLTAVTSGGAIADNADYAVLLEPQALSIGSVNEDFAVESLAGDIFQLGNRSYRILRIEGGKVRVEDAHGQAPNIPFWLGEMPGRSAELSASVARLQASIDQRLALSEGHVESLLPWLQDELGLGRDSAEQLLDYLARARQALGALPSQDTLIMERFFDASGATQLVIHTPFGSRINRAWGLALRKRFCRTFNFELQAAASEDAIVLSLSTSHSFELEEVWHYLRSNSAEAILIQALLDAPLFGVRWRWNAATALALPRYSGGRKVAPQLQRMKGEDLIATVFPDQIACLENIVGEREIPDHPLVQQTLDDCLHEAMDSAGWLTLLRRIESGQITLIQRDLPSPSPLAAAILNARPYAFLDDAPLEERRTQAVLNRRWDEPRSPDDMGELDTDAIAAVAAEAWPAPINGDEMHEALMSLGALAEHEAQPGELALLKTLARTGRAARLTLGDGNHLWLALERMACLQTLYPNAQLSPALQVPAHLAQTWTQENATLELIRARLSGFGPQRLGDIAAPLNLHPAVVELALLELESQGYVMRGQFLTHIEETQWCERHLLARIHRYTVKRLRREIEPVSLQVFMRFLLDWQCLAPGTRLQGEAALVKILEQFEGYSAPAGAWESDLLPARLRGYDPSWLDRACRSGKTVWARLASSGKGTTLRGTPIVLLPRARLPLWRSLAPKVQPQELSMRAQKVEETLAAQGAMFFDDLVHDVRLLRTEVENALQELVAAGRVNADSFAGLRALITPAGKRQARSSRRGRGAFIGGMDDAGRWALLQANGSAPDEAVEQIALVLLRRYGVVFWRLLQREADWLPSWRDLLRALQRLEARGQIRGGRFIDGLSGEQFALPEAIPALREVRKTPLDGSLVSISASDPLNLAGTLLPLPGADPQLIHKTVPALPSNRVLYRDGLPVAALIAGKPVYWSEETTELRQQLIHPPL